MNEQHLAQLIRRIKTARESLVSTQDSLAAVRGSLAMLLNDLQDLTLEDPVVSVPDGDPKLTRFVTYAKKKLLRADGDWVYWTDLRPAHRDRAEYSEPLWEALTEDPELETRTTHWGDRDRREVRYNPLI